MRRLRHHATLSSLIAISFWLCACSSQSPESENPAATPGSMVGCRPSDGDEYAAGMSKPGAAGLFDFTLVSSTPAPPALDDNLFVVQVTDEDDNPAFGELSVALDMPEHGHPSPKQPQISFDAQSQAFVLDPMRLFMVGLWRITFDFDGTASGAPLRDSAVFEFCID